MEPKRDKTNSKVEMAIRESLCNTSWNSSLDTLPVASKIGYYTSFTIDRNMERPIKISRIYTYIRKNLTTLADFASPSGLVTCAEEEKADVFGRENVSENHRSW